MRGAKPKLSISKLSIVVCTVSMWKTDRYVSKLEVEAPEVKFARYTELWQWKPRVHTQLTKDEGSLRCDHQVIRTGLNP